VGGCFFSCVVLWVFAKSISLFPFLCFAKVTEMKLKCLVLEPLRDMFPFLFFAQFFPISFYFKEGKNNFGLCDWIILSANSPEK